MEKRTLQCTSLIHNPLHSAEARAGYMVGPPAHSQARFSLEDEFKLVLALHNAVQVL